MCVCGARLCVCKCICIACRKRSRVRHLKDSGDNMGCCYFVCFPSVWYSSTRQLNSGNSIFSNTTAGRRRTWSAQTIAVIKISSLHVHIQQAQVNSNSTGISTTLNFIRNRWEFWETNTARGARSACFRAFCMILCRKITIERKTVYTYVYYLLNVVCIGEIKCRFIVKINISE